ncbi:hypothetical protein HU200_022155 [Digitaria exilis]|uniref:GATA-type domain-containing protein n=1 Tax=Digitaria exilis TaxID=1010633 RepID=A0A835EXP8_9POAL|nr:hypothetical protein HU200_022155 [Digitaria exilis]
MGRQLRGNRRPEAEDMVVVDALHGDSADAVADELFVGGPDLQSFFDHAALEVKANGGGGGGEEGDEELEWLSNKDAFPTVETMAPLAHWPRTKGVRRRRWEVARRSPPQAPAVARAEAAGWRCRHCGTDKTPQRREGPEGPSTLCNACGMRYRSGRLVPEYRPASSPTFSPELHSNRHRCVVEIRRRREAEDRASLAAAGSGDEKGNEKLEWLLKKGEVLAAAAVRPRTKGMRRPRKALAWPVIAWSPPPAPPCSPAVVGQRQSHGGGAEVAGEPRHVPDGGDHGAGSCTAGEEGRGAVPADDGFNHAAPPALAAEEGWGCQQFGTEKTLSWLEGPERSSTLCNAGVVRCTSGRMVPVQPPASIPTYSPELRFDWHNRVKLHRRLEQPAKFSAAAAGVGEEGKKNELEWPSKSNKDAFHAVNTMLPAGTLPQTKNARRRRRVVELSPPRRRNRLGGEAEVVEQGRVGDGGTAAAVEARAAAAPADAGEDPASAWAPVVPGRRCRHCGTEKTPLWRDGPEGRHTLCNACGVRFRSGRLVPEYRPASSPTFSPGLHSNVHRQVVQLRRRRPEPTVVSTAVAAAAAAATAAAVAAARILLGD